MEIALNSASALKTHSSLTPVTLTVHLRSATCCPGVCFIRRLNPKGCHAISELCEVESIIFSFKCSGEVISREVQSLNNFTHAQYQSTFTQLQTISVLWSPDDLRKYKCKPQC